VSRTSRALLVIAIAVHLAILLSWRIGFLNPLFFDATVTWGHRGWDFYALYQAGHNVLTGYSAYESDGTIIDVVIPGGTYTPFRYLPLSAYTLGALLNALSPLWAYRAWVAFTELVLLGCVLLTWRATRDPDQRVRLVAMWLCYTPYYLELYMGQFSFVQGALVFVMLLYALRGELGFGFDLTWIGSVIWKQYTALLLPLFARLRRWRALILLVLAVLVTSVPYFALVPGSLAAFLRNFEAEQPWFQLGNLGLRQLVFDVMWSVGDVSGVTISERAYADAGRIVVVLFGGLSLALLALDRRPDPLLHICLWVSAYFLIYHHIWEHHYVMALPLLVALALRCESRWLWILYLLLALPTPFYLIDPHGRVAVFDAMRWTPIRPLWQDIVYHASKPLPLLALYSTVAWRIARPVVRGWRQGHFYLWPVSSWLGRGA
jgi:hypothetical protein